MHDEMCRFVLKCTVRMFFFTTGSVFWVLNSTWLKGLFFFFIQGTFTSHLFSTEPPSPENWLMLVALRRCTQREWWMGEQKYGAERKKKNKKNGGWGDGVWRSLNWRETSDVWKHIPQSALRFVTRRSEETVEGRRKEQRVWLIFWKKASESSSKVSDVTPGPGRGSQHLMIQRALRSATFPLTSMANAAADTLCMQWKSTRTWSPSSCSAMFPSEKVKDGEGSEQNFQTLPHPWWFLPVTSHFHRGWLALYHGGNILRDLMLHLSFIAFLLF